jgi:hypothetical protein
LTDTWSQGDVRCLFRLRTTDGIEYEVKQKWLERRRLNGVPYLVWVSASRDGGRSWIDLPMTRGVWSFLRYWGYPTWPPENALKFYESDGRIVLEHRDEWVPGDTSAKPALWQSVYIADQRSWRIKRVRFMDYEGGSDKPESASPSKWPSDNAGARVLDSVPRKREA